MNESNVGLWAALAFALVVGLASCGAQIAAPPPAPGDLRGAGVVLQAAAALVLVLMGEAS